MWESVTMNSIVSRFMKDESGATAIEYGLIAAIIGVGIIAGLGIVRDNLNTMLNDVADGLQQSGS